MKARSKIEALEEYLVFRSREDYTGLWVFIRAAAEELELDEGNKAVRDTTLKIVSDLLQAGFVHPGFPTLDGGFEPWSLSAGQAIDRIAREWDDLDRDPTLGDIVWFEATEKGEEYVADYSPKDSGLAIENTG